MEYDASAEAVHRLTIIGYPHFGRSKLKALASLAWMGLRKPIYDIYRVERYR